jgi:hypothetical protein
MGLKSALLVMLLLLVTSLIYPGSQSVHPNLKFTSAGDISLPDIRQAYEALNDTSLKCEAFLLAMQGYNSLISQKLVMKDSLLTIVDFSLPSSQERFFVIDISHKSIIYKTLVAHGRNSGELYACKFSNKVHSYQSALGFYITGSPYKGGQGYSMILNGVDKGYNDLARSRAIVVHGAEYATRSYIDRYGRLGRSFGCPALPPNMNAAIIDLIKEGSVFFCYFPDKAYFDNSTVLGHIPSETVYPVTDL